MISRDYQICGAENQIVGDLSILWEYSEDGMSHTRKITDGTIVSEVKIVVNGQDVW